MTATRTDLESAFKLLRRIYEERSPFNRMLGLTVVSLTAEGARVRFEMKESLIGNSARSILHGGAISATLDTTGGLTASVGVLARMEDHTRLAVEERIARLGTIDLRIDYLRPGRGACFTAAGTIMRAGNKVAVTRMELTNDSGLLIAVGTGTYLVG